MICLDIPGSSAEGQISHIYSKRMSTIPCGWSLTNANKMAKMRVAYENNYSIREYIRPEKKTEVLDKHQIKAYNIIENGKKSKIYDMSFIDTSKIMAGNKEFSNELREIFKYKSIV